EPTIFNNVSPEATIAQEEIFGPILSVISFDNLEEAIHIANNTLYGLVAHVWTNDLSIGIPLAKRIRSGMVFVNSDLPAGEGATSISIEPYNQSGIGVEMGQAGLEAYLRRQVMWVNHG
ncbi:MAG: aldehyde dehydrogenase family protein, partial [Firmicutes bacterium]|nr:aldehyde dehydrogenase family protein [Bacillota bacterium]